MRVDDGSVGEVRLLRVARSEHVVGENVVLGVGHRPGTAPTPYAARATHPFASVKKPRGRRATRARGDLTRSGPASRSSPGRAVGGERAKPLGHSSRATIGLASGAGPVRAEARPDVRGELESAQQSRQPPSSAGTESWVRNATWSPAGALHEQVAGPARARSSRGAISITSAP